MKSLATQTARATDEIASQIGAMQLSTGEAVTAIKEIGDVIRRVNEVSTTIAAVVEEQGAATQEIARSAQQAAKGTSEVSANIAGVTQAAGETGSAGPWSLVRQSRWRCNRRTCESGSTRSLAPSALHNAVCHRTGWDAVSCMRGNAPRRGGGRNLAPSTADDMDHLRVLSRTKAGKISL